MRKLICAALAGTLLCTALTGCGSQPVVEKDPIDYNQYVNAHGSVALTSENCAFLQDMRLYTLDPDVSAPLAPLCADENCTHSAPTCSAWLDALCIGAWEDMIYYVAADNGGRIGLYCMDDQGRERRLVKELTSLSDWNANCSYQICCGVLAVNYWDAEDKRSVYVCSLDDDSQPECVFGADEDEMSNDYIGLELREGWIFAYARAEGSDTLALWGMALTTGEKRLFDADVPLTARPALRGDSVVWYVAGEGAYSAPLDGSEPAKLFYTSSSETEYGVFDDLYLYLIDPIAGNEMYVIDSTGRTVQTIDEDFLPYFLASTADKVFFADAHTHDTRPQYWLDKTQLASGSAEVHVIEREFG